jgi:uncharacterized protein YkwD
MKTVLRVQDFEERLVPAVVIDSAYEASAWVLINTMRANPTAFADNLQGLVNGTVNSAFGLSKTDPVIADLKAMINNASAPANYTAALALMRATPAAGPLAWDETLENHAGSHNDWMKTNGFEHTGVNSGNRFALPGYTKNNAAPADTWGYNGQYSWWGENISYGWGETSSTKAGLNAGAYNMGGFQQRAAFLDTASFMLELNSSSLGHLQNLLGRDSGPGGNLPTYNAIGLDIDQYEAPANYEAQDSIPEASVTTHRLGMYRPGGSGGFIAGIVYTDNNHNGAYDAGEGANVTLSIRDAGGNGTTYDLSAGNQGAFSEYLANGTYTVTASSGGQTLGSQSVSINNSNAWAGIQLGGIGRPTLSSPIGAQTTLRPNVAWSAADQATGYQVRVDDLTTAKTNLFNFAATTGTSWSPPSDLVSGRSYRVWVRGTIGATTGSWSDPRDFSVAITTRQGPSATVADIRPNFAWSSIDGAHYVLRVDDVSMNLTNIFPNLTVSGTSWEPTTDMASGRTYHWQVRAVNQDGRGVFSTVGTFTIAKPTATGPASGVTNLRPTFSWSGIEAASSYEIRVNDYSANVASIYLTRVTATNWAPPADLASGRTYTWQVRAVNSLGQGMWSVLRSFAVGRPTPNGPTGTVSEDRPTFSWSAIAGSTQYQVRIDDVTAGMTQTTIQLAKTTDTSWSPPIDLKNGHTYRWWVRSMNSLGQGFWSVSRDFTEV